MALAWLYEDMPHNHDCHHLYGFISMGNVVEALVGIMWADERLREQDFVAFRHLVQTQELGCFDDVTEDVWRFLQALQPGLAAWRPLFESHLLQVSRVLEAHETVFWPITMKRNFKPRLVVTHLEAMRMGWRDAEACGAVRGDVVVGVPLPYVGFADARSKQPAALALRPQEAERSRTRCHDREWLSLS